VHLGDLCSQQVSPQLLSLALLGIFFKLAEQTILATPLIWALFLI
jgi:hypothetical protein